MPIKNLKKLYKNTIQKFALYTWGIFSKKKIIVIFAKKFLHEKEKKIRRQPKAILQLQ